MRIRLKIQRQDLPAVQLLWNTAGLRPGSGPGKQSVTFAELLQQVDEIVQLEAENWGLEDYAVEINGFECLHFCSLDQLLKEDDEVLIRPLQTSDLRQRRLSGRIQISADGRHLIDGIAFGRPFLKRPNRVGNFTRPRKRARLLTNNDVGRLDNTLQPLNSGPGALAISFPDKSGLETETSESESNEEVFEDETEDLTEELQGLIEDQGSGESTAALSRDRILEDPPEASQNRVSVVKRATRARGLGIAGSDLLGISDRTKVPPTRHLSLHHSKRQRSGQRTGSTPMNLRSFGKSKPGLDPDSGRHSSQSSTKSVHFEQEDFETPATLREAELFGSSSASEDGDFEPDKVAKHTESDKENVEPHTLETQTEHISSDDDDASDTYSSFSDVSKNSHLSSSSRFDTDADSDTASDSELEEADNTLLKSSVAPSSSELSSSSSDTSTSDSSDTTSESDINSQDNDVTLLDAAKRKGRAQSLETNQRSERNIQVKKFVPKPPGQGLPKTKRRNKRRKWSKTLSTLKKDGKLPQHATIEDCIAWSRQNDDQETGIQVVEDLEQKRQDLLKTMNNGGITNCMSDPTSLPNKSLLHEVTSLPTIPIASPKLAESSIQHAPVPEFYAVSLEDQNVAMIAKNKINTDTSTGNTTRERAQLDLSGSRRMLFGSLGLKTPKDQEEKAGLRVKLMENVKAVAINPRLDDNDMERASPNATCDAWKQSITLKAVECCYDDIELSTPPFPFVQRWDKSQRGSYRENAKRWKTATKTPITTCDSEAKTQFTKSMLDGADEEESSVTNPPGLSQALTDSSDEYPQPPDDILQLPALNRSDIQIGAFIVFSHLELSAATNWEPLTSALKTAKIINISDSGDIELSVAPRDRNKKAFLTDPQSGQRLYSKFEMPGAEDAVDDLLELTFVDLVDPRLLYSPGTKVQSVSSERLEDEYARRISQMKENKTEDLLGSSLEKAVKTVSEENRSLSQESE